ncbi:unnamed protein product [Cladocopium goreaui]|uniref:Copia protein n=1 Tax=Cladocopium goreaui TaxID=2562237 RepID=A0A9P1CGN1_9DINO|nr:unnamed protein product [Cladocopium goreaui]
MLISGNPHNACYNSAKKLLREKFNFKHWTHIPEREKLDFCGCSFVKTSYGYHLGQPDYFSKIKPITIDPKRRDSAMATQNEVSALRAVLGALQWPSTQTAPQLGATVSHANKALKNSNVNKDVGLQFRPLGQISDMVLVAMSDVSWGIRREGHSQGGYLLMLAPKEILDGETTNYIILDWRSFRLPRVSRSSLNSESQACAAAMDSLEYTRALIQGCLNADYTLQSPGEWVISKTALVVDAKALYDSIRAEVPQLSGDKRTKIEVMIVKEKMQECQTLLRWVSSEAQYADGITKPSARQLPTGRLRIHMFKLQADEDFVAAKKKTQQQREATARKFALSKSACKVGGLAHLIFISHIMPVTGFSSDEASWSDDAMRLFEPKRVAFRLAKRNQSVQCEIEYDEMSHISYQLHLEQEDKARLEDSFKREIETLESYAQVMKDTSETNKEDANKFLSQLKTLKVRLQDVEQTLTAKIQEVIELERQIYQVQDSLDRANQANIEFRREVYAINKANRFHLFDDCNVLMQARPITMYICKECQVRRESENAEMGQYQHGWR